MKDISYLIYRVYQIVKYLSIFFMNYFCIFYIVSHAIFLCIIFIRKACFPGRFPLSERLVSFPCKLSLRLGCRAKYKLISRRALADFARGVLHTPLNPRLLNPRLLNPRHGISYCFRVIKPCSCYAHAMPTVCPYHVLFCGHGSISLAESKIQALC